MMNSSSSSSSIISSSQITLDEQDARRSLFNSQIRERKCIFSGFGAFITFWGGVWSLPYEHSGRALQLFQRTRFESDLPPKSHYFDTEPPETLWHRSADPGCSTEKLLGEYHATNRNKTHPGEWIVYGSKPENQEDVDKESVVAHAGTFTPRVPTVLRILAAIRQKRGEKGDVAGEQSNNNNEGNDDDEDDGHSESGNSSKTSGDKNGRDGSGGGGGGGDDDDDDGDDDDGGGGGAGDDEDTNSDPRETLSRLTAQRKQLIEKIKDRGMRAKWISKVFDEPIPYNASSVQLQLAIKSIKFDISVLTHTIKQQDEIVKLQSSLPSS